jgi:hypothetical protein
LAVDQFAEGVVQVVCLNHSNGRIGCQRLRIHAAFCHHELIGYPIAHALPMRSSCGSVLLNPAAARENVSRKIEKSPGIGPGPQACWAEKGGNALGRQGVTGFPPKSYAQLPTRIPTPRGIRPYGRTVGLKSRSTIQSL